MNFGNDQKIESVNQSTIVQAKVTLTLMALQQKLLWKSANM